MLKIILRLKIYMAESFSFDVVSDFERQELVNTLDQVKEIMSWFMEDSTVDLDDENIFIITSELTCRYINDIIRQKAIKRTYRWKFSTMVKLKLWVVKLNRQFY